MGIVEQIRLVIAARDHVFESGIWSMLADDVLRGDWYRPVTADGNFGGTRYMPLFFVLIAGMMRVVADPVVAGCLVFQMTVVALGISIWAVLREMKLAPLSRLPLSGLIVCTATYQDAWFTPRCEYLAAALLVFVLWCLLRMENGGSARWTAAAAVALVLAVLTKFTTILMLLVPLVWLVQRRRIGAALLFATGVGLAIAAALTVVQRLSHGYFFQSVVAAVLGSGSDHTPFGFIRSLWVDETWIDPFMGVILGPALLAWLCGLGPSFRSGRSALAIFSVVALGETLIIHRVPATVAHHNTVLHATCLLTFGWLLMKGSWGRWFPVLGCGLSLVMFVVTAFPRTPSVRTHFIEWGASTVPRVKELLEPVPIGAYYIANNPMLPMVRGERPVAIDLGQGCFFDHWKVLKPKPWAAVVAPYLPFDLHAACAAGPAAVRDFEARLEGRDFAAVVLTDWQHVLRADSDRGDESLPAAEEEVFWASQYSSFQRVRGNYQIVRVRRPYVLLMPRTSTD